MSDDGIKIILEDDEQPVPTEQPKPKLDLNWQPGKRKDAYGRQFLAGIGEIGPGMLGLAGLVGAGYETLARRAFTDDDWKTSWSKSIQEGWDKDLIDTSARGVKAVEDFFEVGAAVTPGEMAARYASFAIPNPASFGKGLTLGANLLTPLVKIAPKAGSPSAVIQAGKGNIGLAKAIKDNPELLKDYLTKGNVIRPAAQIGIAGGIDQGIRSVTDMPTMWNPAKHEDVMQPTDDGINVILDDDDPDTQQQDASPVSPLSDSSDQGFSIISQAMAGTLDQGNDGVQIILDDPLMPTNVEVDPRQVLNDQAIKREEEENEKVNWAIGLGTVMATIGAAYLGRRMATNVAQNAPFDLKQEQGLAAKTLDTVKGIGKSFTPSALNRNIANKMDEIELRLKEEGVSEEVRATLAAQEISDNIGRAKEFLNTGKLDETLLDSMGQAPAFREVYRQFAHMDDNAKKDFIEGIAAHQEDMNRVRATVADALKRDTDNQLTELRAAFNDGTLDEVETIYYAQRELINSIREGEGRVKPGLFSRELDGRPSASLSDEALYAAMARYDASPFNAQFRQMERQLIEINQAMLDMGVKRSVYGKAHADSLKRQFGRTQNGVPRSMYLPGVRDVDTPNFFHRIAAQFGIGTKVGNEMSAVGNMLMRSLRHQKGIDVPLDPFRATAVYVQSSFEHIDKSVKQWNILKTMLGIRESRDAAGNLVPVMTRAVGREDEALEIARPRNEMGDVYYLGHVNMEDAAKDGNMVVKWHEGKRSEDGRGWDVDPIPDHVRSRFNLEEATDPIRFMNAHKDDVLWVQRNGNFHGFYISAPKLKMTMDFDPTLSGGILMRTAHTTKKIFQEGVTGKFSIFAPVSMAYNVAQTGFNKAVSEGGFLPRFGAVPEVLWDSLKGATKIFFTNVADDVAELVAESVARNGILNRAVNQVTPNGLGIFRDKLRRSVENSLLHAMHREFGGTQTSINADQFTTGMSDMFAQAVPFINRSVGVNGVRMMWRLWSHFNTAMHEGTAFGMAARKMAEVDGPLSGDQVRRIVHDVKNYTGDVRRRGSAKPIEAFHAAIPYSGPMIQAWSTMGKAFAQNKKGFMTAAATIVGLPTAMEVTYNSMLDDILRNDDGTSPTFVDPNDPSQREWTYRDYYWKGFTPQQRLNNVIMFIPGKPPWEAALVPMPPELGLFRSVVMEGMDQVFGIADTPASNLEFGDHFKESLARVFDIPVPPIVGALAATQDMTVRMGLIPHLTEEGNQGIKLFDMHTLGQGEQRSYNFGRQRGIHSEVDTSTKAWLGELFGAAALTTIRVYEGVEGSQAQWGDERTAAEHLSQGADEFFGAIKSQGRYAQPIWGKSLRPRANDANKERIVQVQNNMTRIKKLFQATMDQGALAAGKPTQSFLPTTVDPYMEEWGRAIPHIEQETKRYTDNMTRLKHSIQQLENTSKIRVGDISVPVTVEQRNAMIDSYNLELAKEQALLLKEYDRWDQRMSVLMQGKLNDPSVATSIRSVLQRPNPGGLSTAK